MDLDCTDCASCEEKKKAEGKQNVADARSVPAVPVMPANGEWQSFPITELVAHTRLPLGSPPYEGGLMCGAVRKIVKQQG